MTYVRADDRRHRQRFRHSAPRRVSKSLRLRCTDPQLSNDGPTAVGLTRLTRRFLLLLFVAFGTIFMCNLLTLLYSTDYCLSIRNFNAMHAQTQKARSDQAHARSDRASFIVGVFGDGQIAQSIMHYWGRSLGFGQEMRIIMCYSGRYSPLSANSATFSALLSDDSHTHNFMHNLIALRMLCSILAWLSSVRHYV